MDRRLIAALLALLLALAPTALLRAADPLPPAGSSTVDAVLASARQVSAGYQHTCAVTDTGGVKCWGWNDTWQIGDGSHADRIVPVDVFKLTQGVSAVAAGYGHTCALTTQGGVKCWGDNLNGALGDGSGHSSTIPVDVAGLTSGVVAIASGSYHSCAVTSSGGVKCWGSNYYGQMGDGTYTNRATPVDIPGLEGVVAISAGSAHTCALTAAGVLKCWGYNWAGQLGWAGPSNSAPPAEVPGLGASVSAVAAGGAHTCALTRAGSVLCWGRNVYGQLGDNTGRDHAAPTPVAGLGQDVVQVAAGREHTCAVTRGGALKCWGDNGDHQLGDRSATTRTAPVAVIGMDAGVASASLGGWHSCALMLGGGLKCWGSNMYGQLGIAGKDGSALPVAVAALPAGMTRIAVGYSHTCAISGPGAVYCWGQDDKGELGDGMQVDRYLPAVVTGLNSGAHAVTAGESHSCAVTAAGGVQCWGLNRSGQLGVSASGGDGLTPIDATGLTSGVADVAAGNGFSCAVTDAGAVKCWGTNESGQLGDGSGTDRWLPANVSGLASGIRAVSAGTAHACALTVDGGIKCWGSNESGRLGNGSNAGGLVPVDVQGISSGATAVAAGGSHTCAIKKNGRLYCWGNNNWGQLGDGTVKTHFYPTLVSGLSDDIVAVAAGYEHTCALNRAGEVKCWGRNEYGQLGDGTLTETLTPVAVVGLSGVVALAANGCYYGEHTCALTGSGEVKCWGWNHYGQLGADAGRTPVDVVGFAGVPFDTPTPTPTVAATSTPSATATFTPSPTASVTATPESTATPSVTPAPGIEPRVWLPCLYR